MTGCTAPTNPSFPISINQGRTALKQMAADPRPLPRPLILIGGFLDPISTDWMEAELRAISHDRRIVTVCIAGHLSFWGYRRELLEKIAPFLPPDENGRRPEADVVGFSLGGLVARYSAIPENDGLAPLRIARLFTISTPHRGSASAQAFPVLFNLQGELRHESARLREIDNAPRDYPIFPYVRLGDLIVGAKNAAPPGERAWWVYTPWFNFAHEGAPCDPRIMADIARRIRGEEPFSTLPATPLPK